MFNYRKDVGEQQNRYGYEVTIHPNSLNEQSPSLVNRVYESIFRQPQITHSPSGRTHTIIFTSGRQSSANRLSESCAETNGSTPNWIVLKTAHVYTSAGNYLKVEDESRVELDHVHHFYFKKSVACRLNTSVEHERRRQLVLKVQTEKGRKKIETVVKIRIL